MLLALFLGLGGASAMAKIERLDRGVAVPPVAEAPQDNIIQVAPIMGGVVQGQSQIIVTAAGAGPGPAGCVMVDANGVKQIQNNPG